MLECETIGYSVYRYPNQRVMEEGGKEILFSLHDALPI